MNVKSLAATAIALALAVTPLVGCGGQQATNDGSANSTATQTATIDTSTWKTLGDAFAVQTDPMAAASDDNHYLYVFRAGNSIYRVVAKMDADTKKNLDDLVTTPEDIWTPEQKVVANLPLQSVEDLTSKVVSQDELDKLIGKTGKELVVAGFAFQDYSMYGGEQTGATFTKDYLAYNFVFDVSVPGDNAPEDNGTSVMDAKVVEAELFGAAENATDPAQVD